MNRAGGEAEMIPGLRRAVEDSRAKAAATRARRAEAAEPASESPVARVFVDIPLAHLDRPFDYLVPARLADDARPGCRVKVRFAGRDVDGFLLERLDRSDHAGGLRPLRRVVSAEPVLSAAVADLAGVLAARYAGTRADVLRLAVPPRHAAAERRPPDPAPLPPPDEADRLGGSAAAAWAGHDRSAAFLRHLAEGGHPRAVWTAAPGTDWAACVAHAVAATLASGRGSLVCLPDRRDVTRLDAALASALGPGRHVVLTAEAGPAARYRAFLSVSRGAQRVVIGTRGAAFAPVHDLGLVAIWDDGDDLYAEPRAPYPHTRDVLLTRAEREGAAALVGGHARTVEAHELLEAGWAHEIAAPREEVRRRVAVTVTGTPTSRDPTARAARLPREMLDAVRAALEVGPVLVQVPRGGYVPALACGRCRAPARCPVCTGPLRLADAAEPPGCRWCGTAAPDWRCTACGHRTLRAPVVGSGRTAEELGRIFPRVAVVASERDRVRDRVPDRPALVVATPGAEPWVEGGYAAVALLDTWLTMAVPQLRAEEEALRRWLGAGALVRPGGRVLAVGDPGDAALQALVRWDPAGFAAREAAQRAAAHLPPAHRLATLTGEPGAVDDALTLLGDRPELPRLEVLGPVPVAEGESRLVLRVPRPDGAALSAALGEVQRVRSARKLDAVRIQVDPVAL